MSACCKNSALWYECDETFSDECEFAARVEGEWCNHTCQENVFSHECRTKFYITRCENVDFRTRSVRKTAFTYSEWYKSIFHYCNEHGSHENSLYISNIHWIYFIPNQCCKSSFSMLINTNAYFFKYWSFFNNYL